MTAEERYTAFIEEINALASKYGYDCTFDCAVVFDSGFDLGISARDTTFEF